ncbi:hypothetical protein [Deinococcus cellulosilyticus]|uniref:Uncharacterized protein n=1 Tax=Deinococcus cellulosilyticus (strain DSM 18568 / NBRC 106333 / KACC 11606 / 5516J-15) TaxID=1223518 RepID=A0A511MZZ1_DEIC1|nr:hypothetical protein [Deinococcus cellulosilyticus]GEM46132.1 hypothetical protein DC3_17670 [Deinococcus cellulosilyticus NBRC 106333 = KACC 11606]
MNLRPIQPLPDVPNGYMQLENYSSVKRLWTYLQGASQQGLLVRPLRTDSEEVCRRLISGYQLPAAGVLIDQAKTLKYLDEHVYTPHPTLMAALEGNFEPLKLLLSESYVLKIDFTLAFTRSRQLVMKTSAQFVPLPEATEKLDLKLEARRFTRDEWRVLLDRACGLMR